MIGKKRCFECGEGAVYDHHVIPRSLGGTRTVPLCGMCHAKVHPGLNSDIPELTRRAMQNKKANGQVVGTIPYGYRRDGGFLISVLDQQKIIQEVNELYKGGLRLVDIVKTLNSQKKRTRNGSPWTSMQVKRLIVDYKGCYKKGNDRISLEAQGDRQAIETQGSRA